ARWGQTVGWRSFHRSSPAMASSLVWARAISISGLVDLRRPVGFGARFRPGPPSASAPGAPSAFPFGPTSVFPSASAAEPPDVFVPDRADTDRRLDGWTRGASPAWRTKCGGQGASGRPAALFPAGSPRTAAVEPVVSF